MSSLPAEPPGWSARGPARLSDWLPRGRTLPDRSWRSRHAWLLVLLVLHVPAAFAYALAQGYGTGHALVEAALIGVWGLAALALRARRRAAACAVALGLLTASAVGTHLAGGYVEAHFHFFVIVVLLVLYEDWLPYLVAIAYVVVQHGAMGLLDPGSVFNHAAGQASPWKWGAIHGAFIAFASVGGIVSWRLNEQGRAAVTGAYREAAEALAHARESEERFRSAFEGAPIGMALLDPSPASFGRFLRVNRALCEMLGYSEDELLARDFQAITHPDDLDGDLEAAHAFAEGPGSTYEKEKRYLHADGRTIWANVRVSLIRDADGAPGLCIGQVQDISERRRIECELSHRAVHDELTGLANRALFLERLAHALGSLDGRGEVAILFLDLDNFKLVNDTYGHAVGDEVLRAVAARLQGVVREDDAVARFGGDEFALLLCEPDGRCPAVTVAERLATALAEPVRAHGTTQVLSASIGIVVAREPGRDPETLLRDADAAMYRAKARGPAGYEIFEDELREAIVRRAETEQALREALDAGELTLHYQPIVELDTGHVAAVEALARWEHPERGFVPPSEFIPVAEETGMIVELGAQVLHEACTEAVRWSSLGESAPKVAVNISPRQLLDSDFVGLVTRTLDETGLPPQRLALEITETAMLDGDRARDALGALERLGVEAALDDFGARYSSLGQLRGLPPLSVLKIDRSFIAGIEGDASARALVTAVAGMARSLGLRAVAEGLETPLQVRLARALDCPLGQGYQLARPQPAADIRALLAERVTSTVELAALDAATARPVA